MDHDSPVIYGLEFQARALACYYAETELVQYFAGTQSLRCQNQVHLITFEDESNSISKKIFMHPAGEIWSISTPVAQKNLLSTVYNEVSGNKTSMRAGIWRFSTDDDTHGLIDDGTSSAPALQEVTKVETSELGDIKSLLWYPSVEKTEFIILVEGHLLHCDLGSSGPEMKVISRTSLEGRLQPKFTTGCWDPHHNCTQVATAQDTSLRGWDLRTMQLAYSIENAHSHLVRGLDFNPNRQYFVATCGDDCKVKFWDIRKATEPVKTLSDHSHWIWNIKYNHFHDQLVVTSSSDGRVVLTNLPSISSEPYGNLIANDEDEDEGDEDDDRGRGNDEENGTKARSEASKDGTILKYEEHEDSVYGVEWSSADPWVFASLSYDGRLVVGRVPRRIKYQILL